MSKLTAVTSPPAASPAAGLLLPSACRLPSRESIPNSQLHNSQLTPNSQFPKPPKLPKLPNGLRLSRLPTARRIGIFSELGSRVGCVRVLELGVGSCDLASFATWELWRWAFPPAPRSAGGGAPFTVVMIGKGPGKVARRLTKQRRNAACLMDISERRRSPGSPRRLS